MSGIYKLCSWSRIRSIKQAKRFTRFPPDRISGLRALQTSPVSAAKIFFDKENSHSHKILESSSNYQISPGVNYQWESHSLAEHAITLLCNSPPTDPKAIVAGLQDIVGYCNKHGIEIANERFDRFVDTFTDVCSSLTDDQLQTCLYVLQFLPEPPGMNSRNFLELWKSLDDVCRSRAQDWSVDKILLISDYWYRLSLVKGSEFVWEALKKIGRRTRKFTPSQLVQAMFLCNLVRKPLVEMIDFELHLDNVFDSLSVDEVGVMCAGFFKTQTKLHKPELIVKIYRRLMANLDAVDDITLVNYLKTLRYSSKLPQANLMYELLENICSQIGRISLLACLHVALTGCDIQMCHKKCVELILERFSHEVNDARIKDMERICHVMGLFNVRTESGLKDELCRKILKILETRIDEIIRYPKSFQACLHYLTLCGHHNEDMLNAALDPKFIRHVYGKHYLLGREIFCLDSYARINLQDSYRGNLLLDKQRKAMGKLFTHYIPEKDTKFKLNVTDRILVEVHETCRDLFGACSIKHALPHFERPDIVIAYDVEAKRGLPLSVQCPEDYSGKILNCNDLTGKIEKRVQSVAVIIGGWNNFVRGTNMPTGSMEMKLNQLKILGYKTALVPWHEWREQETRNDKQNYVRRKVGPLLHPTI